MKYVSQRISVYKLQENSKALNLSEEKEVSRTQYKKNTPIIHGICNTMKSRQLQFLSPSTKHIFVKASMQFTCNKVVLFPETFCLYLPCK